MGLYRVQSLAEVPNKIVPMVKANAGADRAHCEVAFSLSDVNDVSH